MSHIQNQNWQESYELTQRLQKRGRMQEGMIADITIFNPETITDTFNAEKGTFESEGIELGAVPPATYYRCRGKGVQR